MRRHNPVHERFFHEDAAEPFFIKNLENVQGDERDVIFISVGYGRDAQGRVSMNFGPLNKSGGERRMNVLITRARQRCEVFSNIKAEDLDLSRTQSRGVAALKQYLHYAETGQFSAVDTGVGEPDSPFEVDVADALRRHGYQVHHQVGTVGFYIDLGIVDPAAPGRYLLGIECDGATYHSARAARDRDRLRQSVLERLGWRIHRIWSTDWFQSPRRELRRALDAIEDAKQAAGRTEQTAKPQFEKVSVESVATKSQPILRAERREEPSVTRSTPYTPASVKIRLGHLPLHELPPQRLAGYVEKIVAHESPVHEDVVVRRITKAANVGRAGKRIQSAIFAGISLALAQQGIKRDTSSFLWTVSNNPIAPRDRSDLDHQERKWEFIADAEIAAAIHHSVEASLGMHQDEIPSNAGALLGYSRITRDPASRIEQLVALMVEFELLVAQRDMVLLGPYAGDYGIFRPQ